MKLHCAHKYIVENIDKIAKLANISPQYILSSAKPYCDENDFIWTIEFLNQYKAYDSFYFSGKSGLLYTDGDVIEKFSALCGLFIRYFLDSRVVGPYGLLELLKNENRPDLIFIHAFEYIQFDIKSDLVQFLFNPTIPSVIFIQDKVLFRKIYGDYVYQHILNHYILM